MATSLAAGISPDMEEAWGSLDNELDGLPEDKRDAVLTKSMNFLQTTQMVIAEHQVENEQYEQTIAMCLSKIAALGDSFSKISKDAASKTVPLVPTSKPPPTASLNGQNATPTTQASVAKPYLSALRSPPEKNKASQLLPKAGIAKPATALALNIASSSFMKPTTKAVAAPVSANVSTNIDEEQGMGPLGNGVSFDNE